MPFRGGGFSQTKKLPPSFFYTILLVFSQEIRYTLSAFPNWNGQFETILSINKTRDNKRDLLLCFLRR